jgi:transcription elongation GreA/GreB family factor
MAGGISEVDAGPAIAGSDGNIRIGSRVRVCDDDGDGEFTIVEPSEADAWADRVSAGSPLGGAFLGRRAGDEVRFRAPGGVLAVTVVEVHG